MVLYRNVRREAQGPTFERSQTMHCRFREVAGVATLGSTTTIFVVLYLIVVFLCLDSTLCSRIVTRRLSKLVLFFFLSSPVSGWICLRVCAPMHNGKRYQDQAEKKAFK